MENNDILELAHRVAWKYKHSADSHHSDTYTFNRGGMLDFSRRLLSESKDTARIDWLADKENLIGNVQLPARCVSENIGSLRCAIDAAMQIGKET
jgi:hypothetical protein